MGVKPDSEKELVAQICNSLKKVREKQGMSQRKLSELTGLSPTGIRHIESLDTNPTLYSLLKVSNALKINLAKMLLEP